MITDDMGGGIVIDTEVVEDSENPVSSGAVYNAIAAIPTPDVSGQINTHNTSTSAHSDIRTEVSAAKAAADALSRLHSGLGDEYVWEKSKSQDTVVAGASQTWGVTTPIDSAWVQISSTVEVVNGAVVLVNPVTYTYLSANVSAILAALAGNYFIHSHMSTTTVYKDGGCYKSGTGIMWVYYPLSISTEVTVYGYVNSPNPNAYPPAVDDGYTYTALGMLGEKVKIATGSYTGTGTHGISNPNSLTFDFEPKLVIIRTHNPSGQNGNVYGTTLVRHSKGNGATYLEQYNDTYGMYSSYLLRKWVGNTVYWYSPMGYPGDQLNEGGSNYIYYYVAIG